MNVNELLAICNGSLTGDLDTDLAFLQTQMKRHAQDENATELLNAVSDLALSLLPAEQQEKLKETTFVNGKRLDAVYHDAQEQVNAKKFDEAAMTLRALTNKINEGYGKDPEVKFLSFRNPFEYHLYHQIYGAEQKVERAPFDFAMYFTLLGYTLIELHRLDEAVEALEQAIRYNPVSPDVRFELTEAFKLMQEPKKLLAAIRDTLPLANSTYALSRCYANLGYYCIEIKDYDAAVCFYYESLVYSEHPGVRAELVHLRGLMGKQISPPTREEVLKAFEKYDIPNGPSKQIVSLALALAEYVTQQNDTKLSGYFYSIAYDLTRDPELKKKLEALDQQAKAEAPEQK